MEKIININFQGRVIPIEETAYNNLKQYIEALRGHFANEENHEEIISDIENRIAELLSERLKQGASCIGNDDLNAVINSIGRLEDLEDIEGVAGEENKASASSPSYEKNPAVKTRFFRNADDKVIAGICSAIAIRLGLDPIVIRILFVLLFGALFWVYILLWIIVPSQSVRSQITKRLFRNPDDKIIAGVCGGLAEYFRTDGWKMRLIFLVPLVFEIIFKSIPIFDWHIGVGFFTASITSTLVILYIVFWIAIPYASSATDKMEMRGEKIDLNSIKAATQARTNAPTANPRGARIGSIIGLLFKAFFFFIAGIMALSLFGVLIGLVFAGTAAAPFTDFILSGYGQHALAWTGVALTLGIPFLALTVWIVRRIMGVHSRRHYLGFVFGGLWFIGIICSLTVTGMLMSDFSSRSVVEETDFVQQPSQGKVHIHIGNYKETWYHARHDIWFDDWDVRDAPFNYISNDSLWINAVKLNIEQSPDSFFHIYKIKTSRGHTSAEAKARAEHIAFPIEQMDSVINLPRGFTISRKDKFRNQQVLVTIEVPLGNTIQLDKDINHNGWFKISSHGRRIHYEQYWNGDEDDEYESNRDYIMTRTGIEYLPDTVESRE